VQRQTLPLDFRAFCFVHPAQALLNSTQHRLARDRRAVAQGDRLQPMAVSVVEKNFLSNVAAGQLEDRSRISTDLKDFLPRFLVLRKLSHVVDGQHVGRRRPDFFQGFHFGMSRSFARLSISFLSFFTDGPANPE
jgi:hypothetical protein